MPANKKYSNKLSPSSSSSTLPPRLRFKKSGLEQNATRTTGTAPITDGDGWVCERIPTPPWKGGVYVEVVPPLPVRHWRLLPSRSPTPTQEEGEREARRKAKGKGRARSRSPSGSRSGEDGGNLGPIRIPPTSKSRGRDMYRSTTKYHYAAFPPPPPHIAHPSPQHQSPTTPTKPQRPPPQPQPQPQPQPAQQAPQDPPRSGRFACHYRVDTYPTTSTSASGPGSMLETVAATVPMPDFTWNSGHPRQALNQEDSRRSESRSPRRSSRSRSPSRLPSMGHLLPVHSPTLQSSSPAASPACTAEKPPSPSSSSSGLNQPSQHHHHPHAERQYQHRNHHHPPPHGIQGSYHAAPPPPMRPTEQQAHVEHRAHTHYPPYVHISYPPPPQYLPFYQGPITAFAGKKRPREGDEVVVVDAKKAKTATGTRPAAAGTTMQRRSPIIVIDSSSENDDDGGVGRGRGEQRPIAAAPAPASSYIILPPLVPPSVIPPPPSGPSTSTSIPRSANMSRSIATSGSGALPHAGPSNSNGQAVPYGHGHGYSYHPQHRLPECSTAEHSHHGHHPYLHPHHHLPPYSYSHLHHPYPYPSHHATHIPLPIAAHTTNPPHPHPHPHHPTHRHRHHSPAHERPHTSTNVSTPSSSTIRPAPPALGNAQGMEEPSRRGHALSVGHPSSHPLHQHQYHFHMLPRQGQGQVQAVQTRGDSEQAPMATFEHMLHVPRKSRAKVQAGSGGAGSSVASGEQGVGGSGGGTGNSVQMGGRRGSEQPQVQTGEMQAAVRATEEVGTVETRRAQEAEAESRRKETETERQQAAEREEKEVQAQPPPLLGPQEHLILNTNSSANTQNDVGGAQFILRMPKTKSRKARSPGGRLAAAAATGGMGRAFEGSEGGLALVTIPAGRVMNAGFHGAGAATRTIHWGTDGSSSSVFPVVPIPEPAGSGLAWAGVGGVAPGGEGKQSGRDWDNLARAAQEREQKTHQRELSGKHEDGHESSPSSSSSHPSYPTSSSSSSTSANSTANTSSHSPPLPLPDFREEFPKDPSIQQRERDRGRRPANGDVDIDPSYHRGGGAVRAFVRGFGILARDVGLVPHAPGQGQTPYTRHIERDHTQRPVQEMPTSGERQDRFEGSQDPQQQEQQRENLRREQAAAAQSPTTLPPTTSHLFHQHIDPLPQRKPSSGTPVSSSNMSSPGLQYPEPSHSDFRLASSASSTFAHDQPQDQTSHRHNSGPSPASPSPSPIPSANPMQVDSDFDSSEICEIDQEQFDIRRNARLTKKQQDQKSQPAREVKKKLMFI